MKHPERGGRSCRPTGMVGIEEVAVRTLELSFGFAEVDRHVRQAADEQPVLGVTVCVGDRAESRSGAVKVTRAELRHRGGAVRTGVDTHRIAPCSSVQTVGYAARRLAACPTTLGAPPASTWVDRQ